MIKQAIVGVALLLGWGSQDGSILKSKIALEPRVAGFRSQSFTVQALSTFNGTFWQGCTGDSMSSETWSWTPYPGAAARVRTIQFYTLNGACQNPLRYYNGGWVSIFDQYDGQESLIGSVDANMVKKTITYDGSATSFRLEAHPYTSQDKTTCNFIGFEGHTASETSIVVTGLGDLPMANFECATNPH